MTNNERADARTDGQTSSASAEDETLDATSDRTPSSAGNPASDDLLLDDDAEESAADGENESEDAGDERPKRRSRSQRLRDANRSLRAENEALRRQLEPPGLDAIDPLRPPRQDDFPNDPLTYERAVQAFNIRHAIREENARSETAREAARQEAAYQDRMRIYEDRLDEVRDRIPDFGKTMTEARALPIRNGVRDLILDSDKAPLIAYHLAKNPDKLDELNRMHPVAAARMIGRLEARIRSPQPNQATRTPAPISAPRGGSAPPTRDPATMSMADYVKARETGTF